jgi:hypothetical protein
VTQKTSVSDRDAVIEELKNQASGRKIIIQWINKRY